MLPLASSLGQTRGTKRSLGEFPWGTTRIECQRCGRGAGSYRLDGLRARFGQDAALPDVLMAQATCDRRRDFTRPCGAVYGSGCRGPLARILAGSRLRSPDDDQWPLCANSGHPLIEWRMGRIDPEQSL